MQDEQAAARPDPVPAGASFTSWYRVAWPRLVSALTVVTRDREVAADVCAEAVSRLWERWEGGTVQDPAAWTYRVAVNLAKRRGQRAALEARLLRRHRIEDAVDGPEATGPAWAAVAQLPDRQRTVVALRYLADLTQPQIAEALGISTGTVASTLHDARRSLAATLGPDAFDEGPAPTPSRPDRPAPTTPGARHALG
ncbi:sigma-70 family RNA polymerase sigma factor [Aquihabitans sp. G128]|uniref:RNA polymerase sigma factor n=1 Tax=Aquihabitans sp. G128 TaxID=2849779 RepID=UPI001C22E926|nr:sigma-70 family RNA polymerase sigma factor [Aquihabitans sp. G128]QXC60038.1 sigma-70 family RNA polymerase sigma factor [Aquihabitans sp. G128]